MGETNSPSVAHVGYDISPLLRVIFNSGVEKYRNPLATEGESIYLLLEAITLTNIPLMLLYGCHMQ